MSHFYSLLIDGSCTLLAPVSKKRVILKEKANRRNKPEEAKVFLRNYKKRGASYQSYIVRGWKTEEGKPGAREFKDEAAAKAFASEKNIELLNKGRKQRLVMTALTESQAQQAERAFDRLGDAYSMDEAIDFYLRHHRPTDFKIRFSEGLDIYMDHKEREGVRDTTRKRVKAILKRFSTFTNDEYVHALTGSQIQSFLDSLTSRDGSPAKRKTFNNYRNELASFFKWAAKKDLSTNRPWTFNDPLEDIEAHSTKRVAEQRPEIAVTAPERVQELFSYLMSFRQGRLVKYFALAYFAGIRPSTDQGELVKLAERESELINLTTGVINLPASVTKTKDKRQIRISDNLMVWLKTYEGLPIAPKNLKNDYRTIRQKFYLQNDETRHSYISYHVALHRSIGDTALQAGNSEQMIKRHYLDHCPKEEGEVFFSIIPDIEAGEAKLSEIKPQQEVENFRVV